MRILVTRPEPEAGHWVADLRAQGLDADALPLIAIEGPADPAPVQQAWAHMASLKLLMFVSPAAVEWFFKLRPAGTRWGPHTLAAAPGPGTARRLLSAGLECGLTEQQLVSPSAEATQFDSEHLWPLLAPLDWAGQQVGIVSGGDSSEAKGRTWLTAQWQAQGAQVQTLLTYQRTAGQWTTAQQALAREALEAPPDHVWLFSSSQAIDHLAQVHLPALGLLQAPNWRQARALATHPRIAERAAQLGFGEVLSAKPTLDAVVQALRTAA
jgi:uroporphyrinogen-III synthase